MRLDPAKQTELSVLESRLNDRTLPQSERDRLQLMRNKLLSEITGQPSKDELDAMLARIEKLEEGQGKLHEGLAALEARLGNTYVTNTQQPKKGDKKGKPPVSEDLDELFKE